MSNVKVFIFKRSSVDTLPSSAISIGKICIKSGHQLNAKEFPTDDIVKQTLTPSLTHKAWEERIQDRAKLGDCAQGGELESSVPNKRTTQQPRRIRHTR
jgi:hypothetical protein